MGDVGGRTYHFDLVEGAAMSVDDVGVRLADDARAVSHARRVLCEVAQDGAEAEYRVDVRGADGGRSFSLALTLTVAHVP